MSEEIDRHIEAVERLYAPLIVGGGSCLIHGDQLWRQFQDAIAAYRKNGIDQFRQVIERTNELAVARITLLDPLFADGQTYYEPHITADDRRIDFMMIGSSGSYHYREVKTIHPAAEDSLANWQKVQKRQKLHPENVKYIVNREWLGAAIYGNSFSARSSFMNYTLEYESKLVEVNKIHPGHGELVFCGAGFEWDLDELEDFVDFYRTGKHRSDDPFAKMEAVWLSEKSIHLTRNISAFGFMKRPQDSVLHKKWVSNVEGPVIP